MVVKVVDMTILRIYRKWDTEFHRGMVCLLAGMSKYEQIYETISTVNFLT